MTILFISFINSTYITAGFSISIFQYVSAVFFSSVFRNKEFTTVITFSYYNLIMIVQVTCIKVYQKCDKNYKSNVMSEPKAENQTV